MAKLFASRMAEQVTSKVIEVYGDTASHANTRSRSSSATRRSARSTKGLQHAAPGHRQAAPGKM